MALNLKKGGRFDLQKSSPGLSLVGVGLGWDPNTQDGGPAFDLDASAFMLGSNNKISNDGYLVFYGNPISSDGAVKSSGDDKTGGSSDGDDETIYVDLNKVDKSIQQIVFTVTICKYPNDDDQDKRTLELNFGQVKNCFIRIYNKLTNEELIRFDLNEKFTNEDAVEFGKLFRTENGWEFQAIGKGLVGSLDILIGTFVNKNADGNYSFKLSKKTGHAKKAFNLSKKSEEIVSPIEVAPNSSIEKKTENKIPYEASESKKSEHNPDLKSPIKDTKSAPAQKSKKGIIIAIFVTTMIIFSCIYFFTKGESPVEKDNLAISQSRDQNLLDSNKDSANAATRLTNETPAATNNDQGNASSQPAVSDEKVSMSNAPMSSANDSKEFDAPKVACNFPALSSQINLSIDILAQIKEALTNAPAKKIVVEGYASSEGQLEKNNQLSQKRADAFKTYLINNGIPAEKISAIGKGIENPIASNENENGRMKNRRVELVIK